MQSKGETKALWSNPIRIRGLIAGISSIHPLLFMLMYLAMIPIFALIYVFVMPAGSLYAPYARLEPSAASDIDRIGKTIEGALRRATESTTIEIDGRTLRRLAVFNPRSRDGSSIEFTILGTFEKMGGTNSADVSREMQPVGIDLLCSMPAGIDMLVGPRPDETANIARPVLLDVSAYPSEFQQIEEEFYKKLLTTPFFPNGRSLIFTRQESGQVDQFFDGFQGNPIAIDSAFPRMLYFSAMVTTTVGFGDIVPMTTVARLCVGFQAVLGIFIAGLFLNAIAYRSSHKPT